MLSCEKHGKAGASRGNEILTISQKLGTCFQASILVKRE